MPLDEDNIIEQLAQIESELSGTSTTEGEISNVSQVDSVVASVIPVDISQNYRGTIGEEDWVLRDDGFYYYKVTYATHRLLTPYVDKYLVATEDGYENAFYSYIVLADKSIRFRSSMPVNCEYNITGER